MANELYCWNSRSRLCYISNFAKKSMKAPLIDVSGLQERSGPLKYTAALRAASGASPQTVGPWTGKTPQFAITGLMGHRPGRFAVRGPSLPGGLQTLPAVFMYRRASRGENVRRWVARSISLRGRSQICQEARHRY